MARKSARKKVALDCSACGRRNYTITKNRSTTPEKIVLKKHCPHCNAHTEHQEGK